MSILKKVGDFASGFAKPPKEKTARLVISDSSKTDDDEIIIESVHNISNHSTQNDNGEPDINSSQTKHTQEVEPQFAEVFNTKESFFPVTEQKPKINVEEINELNSELHIGQLIEAMSYEILNDEERIKQLSEIIAVRLITTLGIKIPEANQQANLANSQLKSFFKTLKNKLQQLDI